MEENKIHEKYMKKVFFLARKGEGKTSPNPMVGAIVLKDGKIIGRGFHRGPGSHHAEIVALKMAGNNAQGADLYINLEPCAHYGRTPPCVDAVIEKGIKRVIISNQDPNPLVNGKSIQKMKDHNIDVIQGILEREGFLFNESFFKYITTGRPFVALKAAASLDGKIATSTGESKWITGETSRNDSQKLRKKYDGILVGINTITEDDPLLTCRIKGGINPVRIILDSNLKISTEAKILNLEDSLERTIVFTTKKASEEKLLEIREKGKVVVFEEEVIQINKVLKYLSAIGITSLLVEGGSTVHGSFITEKIPDKYYFYYAPMLIGGKDSPGIFGDPGFLKLSEALRLKVDNVEKTGQDIKVTLYPE